VRAFLLVAAVSGCSFVVEFDRARVDENSDEICGDGIDNDGDELADCLDWGCLAQPICCDIQTVVLRDLFEGPGCAASCDAPDPACAIDEGRWQAWGSPTPVVCDGGLNPNKIEQCYDVGVISRDGFAIGPGLEVRAGVAGRPELVARVEVGLTLQDSVEGAIDHCALITTADPVIAVRVVSSANGWRALARFDRSDLGLSPEIADEARHELAIVADDAGGFRWELDGVEFARSPADQPIPPGVLTAHVSLAGRGEGMIVDDVRVVTGTRCDTPGTWTPAEPFVALSEALPVGSWDVFAVSAPDVAPEASGRELMMYTGCPDRGGECDRVRAGAGRAREAAAGGFERAEDCPIFGATGEVCAGASVLFDDAFNNAIDVGLLARADGTLVAAASLRDGGNELVLLSSQDAATWSELPGGRLRGGEGWDAGGICCVSPVERDGRLELWYEGRGADGLSRIGRADVGTDGTIVPDPANPVLDLGAPGEHDGRGVGAPDVVWDPSRGVYRMWYAARGFLGTTSIGYAVSLDGRIWHRFPENPIIDPEAVGLKSVGAPSVRFADDGVRMWIEGEAIDLAGQRIYELRSE
jgi:hypothetical protein